MNLNQIASYEQNIKTVQNPSTAETAASAKAANAAALGGVSAGQIVTGEVSKIRGNQVQIQLPDSKVVTARLEADIKVSVGQSLAFEVKSNTGSQIALTPLFNNTAVNPAAIKALGQASILVTQSTLSMAAAMMDEGMGIDRNSLQSMFRTVNKYPDANPADIVAMSKQGIEINSENISQFSAYRNNDHQIIELATQLADQMGEVADELSLDGKNQLAGIFNGEGFSEALSELAEGLSNESREYELSLAAAPENEPSTPPAHIGQLLSGAATDGEMLLPENFAEAETLSQADVVIANDTDLTRLLDEGERAQLSKDLSALGLSAENAAMIEDGTMDPSKVLAYMQGALSMASEAEFSDSFLNNLVLSDASKEEKNAAINNIAHSEAFKKLLKDSILRDFSIKADGTTDKEQVKELYERILKDSQKASQVLEAVGKGGSEAAKGLENMRQNVNFMNQLNETFNYIQLPIQLAGENAHGDLYVYTNKKKLSEKDGNVTALLHLEMETLGTMDIHVTMTDYTNVKTHFMLESDEMIDFIAENIHVLDERLQKRGYSMTSSVTSKKDAGQEAENPAIQAMLGGGASGKGGHVFSKYSFDVKA